ncbi:hypothetical protein GCK72_001541 [Caenorhabditis remanei]|uniref:Uncharacterized protein n=1 Tax=Caenorhabditis remanei TaxID=31234 RepID=A0A6A5HSY7_CAERE|nr:hypothetical protein GCK72_001541 [Caenorhabditis remanei]KAF1769724.1 hypothetical protein GCK72_001541 [Caenorhabditis remanei]
MQFGRQKSNFEDMFEFSPENTSYFVQHLHVHQSNDSKGQKPRSQKKFSEPTAKGHHQKTSRRLHQLVASATKLQYQQSSATTSIIDEKLGKKQ